MKPKPYQTAAVAILLLFGAGLTVAGCMGFADTANSSMSASTTRLALKLTTSSDGESVPGGATGQDLLSTFEQKDPFIQQAIPVEPTTETSTSTPPTSAASSSTTSFSTDTTRRTTTTYRVTTTSWWVSTTTTTAHATTTTAAHAHDLKVLSVATVDGAPAVTLQVDNSIYKNKRAGDVLSTSWGQIKIIEITTASKVVTLLHGSETLVLAAGQHIYE